MNSVWTICMCVCRCWRRWRRRVGWSRSRRRCCTCWWWSCGRTGGRPGTSSPDPSARYWRTRPPATSAASARYLPKRGRESPVLALWAGAHTDIWLEGEDLGTSMLLCPGKKFRQGKQKCSFIVMEYSALFNNVFEAVNLFLTNLFYLCSRNSATWQCNLARLK